MRDQEQEPDVATPSCTNPRLLKLPIELLTVICVQLDLPMLASLRQASRGESVSTARKGGPLLMSSRRYRACLCLQLSRSLSNQTPSPSSSAPETGPCLICLKSLQISGSLAGRPLTQTGLKSGRMPTCTQAFDSEASEMRRHLPIGPFSWRRNDAFGDFLFPRGRNILSRAGEQSIAHRTKIGHIDRVAITTGSGALESPASTPTSSSGLTQTYLPNLRSNGRKVGSSPPTPFGATLPSFRSGALTAFVLSTDHQSEAHSNYMVSLNVRGS